MSLVCVYCGAEVNERTDYRRVFGWERKAKSETRRGGSDISHREYGDEMACFVCIHRLKSGLNVQQETLV